MKFVLHNTVFLPHQSWHSPYSRTKSLWLQIETPQKHWVVHKQICVGSGQTKANDFSVFVFLTHSHDIGIIPRLQNTVLTPQNLKLCRSDTRIQGPINLNSNSNNQLCTLLQLWWNVRTTEISKSTASWELQTELYPGLDASYSRFSCKLSSEEVVVRVALSEKQE